ncbi:MAG: tRNA (guanosine(46)-N7)-methyltransferase TrmB [Verrucomicrobia bacterium]|nr:tRNA (guanosine(46)-N7)-methyltransferase TrmB [Verrucomicrobiota bacterium]
MTGNDAIFVPDDYFREISLGEIFLDGTRPLEVDLGCGDGLFLEQMAALYPERNFLGVERLIGRVDKTSRRLARQGIKNARVLRLESSYTIAWLLPPRSVSRLHLLCPDPWPKQGHWRNRIVNDPEFLSGLQRVLQPDGEFLFKSDDETIFANALESIGALSGLEKLDWPDDAFPYPETAFERQWLALSRTMQRARWRRMIGFEA